MKNLEFKIVMIYLSIIVYLLLGHIIFVDKIIRIEDYLNPLFWLVLCIITYMITRSEKGRYKDKKDKVQVVFIIVLLYLMLYFSTGLIVGYVRSPYSHSFMGIVNNIWSFLTVIIFQEYIRTILVSYTRKRKYLYLLIVILFSLFEINFYQIGKNFTTFEIAFKYISSTALPIFVKNCVLTYLSVVAGIMAPLLYRLPITLATIILPILPDYNWFLTGITGSLLPLFIYIFINKIDEARIIKERNRRKKRKGIPILILGIIVILFVSGVFKYKPLSIMSNSMADIFNRGDVVIIKKVSENDNLDVNDIIEYELDNVKIVHRIIEVRKNDDGNIVYRTKGDNNNTPDIELVNEEQIKGVVRLKIPKIGYPSVWLSEVFNNNQPNNIETPK